MANPLFEYIVENPAGMIRDTFYVSDVFRRRIISWSWHALISNIALSVNHLWIFLARDTLREGTFPQFFRELGTVEIYWCRHASVVIKERSIARNLDTLRCWELCARDANRCSILTIVAYNLCKKDKMFFIFLQNFIRHIIFNYEIFNSNKINWAKMMSCFVIDIFRNGRFIRLQFVNF